MVWKQAPPLSFIFMKKARKHGVKMYPNYAIDLGLMAKTDNREWGRNYRFSSRKPPLDKRRFLAYVKTNKL
jgi:hypothetical protein